MNENFIKKVYIDIDDTICTSKEKGKYNWSKHQRMSELIIENGLKWTPVFAFNRCGRNVGDDVDIFLPKWIWTKYSSDPNFLKFKSEQGNYSNEFGNIEKSQKNQNGI